MLQQYNFVKNMALIDIKLIILQVTIMEVVGNSRQHLC